MTGPGDEMAAGAAGRGRMRASHADREQVIEALKDAFADGRLSRDELDTRAGQALTARTRADLAALTADIPPAPVPVVPAAARPARRSASARRRPLAKAAAGSGLCLALAAAAVKVSFYFDPGGPGPNPHSSWARPFSFLAVAAVITALGILVVGFAISADQRRSRRQLPPRPGPGGRPAIEAGQRGGTGDGPVPPGPRTDQARADLRSDSSQPGRPHSSRRGARAPRGIRAVPDSV